MKALVSKELPEPAEIRTFLDLLCFLLADIRTDIGVSARELQLSDASFVRLRRARDRVACAQSLLESMGVESVGACGVSAKGDEMAECAEARVRVRMGKAVELLARGWPDEYPDGAVEFEILSQL